LAIALIILMLLCPFYFESLFFILIKSCLKILIKHMPAIIIKIYATCDMTNALALSMLIYHQAIFI